MKKIVTIDFDHTLKFETGETNEPTIKQIKALSNCILFVVTSRMFSDESLTEIKLFLSEHEIEVEKIIHTNGNSKLEALISLKSELHFEDDIWAIEDLKRDLPNIQIVNCFNLKKWQEYFQGL
jgi:hypothetical protein